MPVPIVLIVPVLLLVAGLLHFVPQLTRPDLFFAVTVPPEFRRSKEGRQILQRYRVIVWSSTLLAIAMAAAGLPLAAVLIPGAGYLWGFVNSHQRAMAYAAAPDPITEVDLAAPREGFPGGAIVALLPVVALAALGTWAAFHWDRLPERLVVHWVLNGADGWVNTTPTTFFGLLAVYASTCLLLVGVAWGLLHGSRRISTSGPAAASERQFRRRIVLMLIVTEYLTVFPAAFSLLMPAAPGMTIWGVALAFVIVGFAVSLFRSGQGGARAMVLAGGAPTGDRTPDACWKWGMFYVNPADPSILVEKRFGIGYTVNFGNRWSWVALVVVLVPAALGVIFLR
jgi:uncharacterized membrane protein